MSATCGSGHIHLRRCTAVTVPSGCAGTSGPRAGRTRHCTRLPAPLWRPSRCCNCSGTQHVYMLLNPSPQFRHGTLNACGCVMKTSQEPNRSESECAYRNSELHYVLALTIVPDVSSTMIEHPCDCSMAHVVTAMVQHTGSCHLAAHMFVFPRRWEFTMKSPCIYTIQTIFTALASQPPV